MPHLVPIQLEDGTEIYLEATDDIVAPEPPSGSDEVEVTRTAKGIFPDRSAVSHPAVQSFQAIESTIRAYTNYTMNAFRNMTSANVDRVTLEFGLKVGGEAGVPYVTKGTAESNLKITVECSFKDPKPEG